MFQPMEQRFHNLEFTFHGLELNTYRDVACKLSQIILSIYGIVRCNLFSRKIIPDFVFGTDFVVKITLFTLFGNWLWNISKYNSLILHDKHDSNNIFITPNHK